MKTVNGYPCWLFCAGYLIGLGGFAGLIPVRALVLIIETQFAKLARKDHQKIADDSHSASTNPPEVNEVTLTVLLLLKLATGCISVDQLNINDLVFTKKTYSYLGLIFFLPCLVTFILVVTIVPPFRDCNDCDAFLELPIAMFVSTAFVAAAALRTVVIARQVAGWDEQGIVFELFFILFVVAPTSLLGWVVVIIDPNRLNYQREANWTWLFIIPAFLYWGISLGYQFYRVFQDESAKRVSIEIGNMKTMCSNDTQLRTDFVQFAQDHYVVEIVNFLEDALIYKKMFFEKVNTSSDSWTRNLDKITNYFH